MLILATDGRFGIAEVEHSINDSLFVGYLGDEDSFKWCDVEYDIMGGTVFKYNGEYYNIDNFIRTDYSKERR